jgi:hypothetical protein
LYFSLRPDPTPDPFAVTDNVASLKPHDDAADVKEREDASSTSELAIEGINMVAVVECIFRGCSQKVFFCGAGSGRIER